LDHDTKLIPLAKAGVFFISKPCYNKLMSNQKDFSKFSRDLEEESVKKQAALLGVPYYDLRFLVASKEALKKLPKEKAQANEAVPLLLKEDGTIFLGTPDTENPKLASLISELEAKNPIELVLISKSSFKKAMEEYAKLPPPQEAPPPQGVIILKPLEFQMLQDFEAIFQKTNLEDLLSSLIFAAIKTEASDIHIEPRETNTEIRFRIDGVLNHAATIPLPSYQKILFEIKRNADLKEIPEPQQGRLEARFKEKVEGLPAKMDMRIETNPAMKGEDIVIRLFNIEVGLLDLLDLGISTETMPLIEEFLFRPSGAMLIVGPTGSGKTTTIYAILNKLNTPAVKIITIEDPIEYALPGVTQTQINSGELFDTRLKAILREDPDIVMVGEIRDADSAKTALRAAITGHTLISTLHANNAPTAIIRLLDILDDPNLIVSSLNMIVAQRLVRKLCQFCKEEYAPPEFVLKETKKIIDSLPHNLKTTETKFYKGPGCPHCNGVGFKGRIGVFEILRMAPELENAIAKKLSLSELREIAFKTGMITMEQDGILKALAGITSPEEVLRTVKE